jgi:hypothetical protein
MPVFIIGAVVGAGAVYFASDKAENLVKWGAIAGGVYVAGKMAKVI